MLHNIFGKCFAEKCFTNIKNWISYGQKKLLKILLYFFGEFSCSFNFYTFSEFVFKIQIQHKVSILGPIYWLLRIVGSQLVGWFLKKIINRSSKLGLFILLSCLEKGVVFSSPPPGYYMYQEQLSPESKDWPEL